MDPQNNILFVYSYTDGQQNKRTDEIVFANPDGLSLGEIEYQVKSRLEALEYFYPGDLMVPALYGEYADLDKNPARHAFENLCLTPKEPTDKRSISDFLAAMK